VLIASHARDLLNLRRLPAMLTVAQTAVLLNRGEHDIPVLVRAGILKPLGDPPPNAVKFFATVEVLELADDRKALDRICSILTEYWRGKNESRNGLHSPSCSGPARRPGNGNGQPNRSQELASPSGPEKR
jgi:hypothetical protein